MSMSLNQEFTPLKLLRFAAPSIIMMIFIVRHQYRISGYKYYDRNCNDDGDWRKCDHQ